MASALATLSLSPKTSLPEWKKMKVQELREVLASKGLETLGLKSSLIERLENSAKSDETKPVAEGTARPLEEIEVKVEGELSQKLSNLQDMIKPIEELASSGSSEKLPVAEQLIATETNGIVKQIEERMTLTPASVLALQEINGMDAAPPSETQKKKRRAERFGVEFQMSEQEKRRLRATRFGAASSKFEKGYQLTWAHSNKLSPTSKEIEAEKRKARAARFGTSESSPRSPSDEAAKRKARLARFGSSSGAKTDLSSEEEKKKARAARFGSGTKKEVLNGGKKFLEESVKFVSHA
ncbi:hypothetical protein O6H91_05G108400 [Diphasiastrum complanatum]|uniref:Uncharacterized protein n=1 Tax=Diphasiastrum complanatum TaxID=34168 RepID=A0ACC2DRS3_DIPCM|nr:hypothetical protein O6H91_Y441600 [Diphasiastrum complanatum]KAJ7557009.1 hypothetical protein O6H91_05G108400 [Diphasiastrum complanatum]